MLSPVPNVRAALAAQASKLSGSGARDDGIGLLRHAVLEYSSALEHKTARLPCNVPDDRSRPTNVAEPSPRYIIKYSTCPSPAISPVNDFVTAARVSFGRSWPSL